MQYKTSYIYNFLGRFVPQLLYLATTIVLARFLTPADFGSIGVLTIFISLAITLSDSGFSGSLIQEKDVTKLDYSTIFVFNICISVFIYFILCLSAEHIETFYQYPQLSNLLYALCPVFIIRAIGIVPKTILIRNINFRLLAIISVVSVIMACTFGIIAGVIGLGAYALVIYQLSFAFLETLFSIIFTKYRISFSFDINSLKKLFSFGFFTTLSNVIDSIYENLLTNIFGKTSGISVAGYYSQAYKLENASTNAMVQTLNSVSYPILARKRDNICEFNQESRSIRMYFIRFIFPLIFLIILFSHEIILIVYGAEWVESAKYLKLLMFVGMFYILENLERNSIKSLGHVKSLLYMTILKRLVGIGIIILFLMISPFYMIYGFIISTAIGYLCNKLLYCNIINGSFLKSLIKDIQILLLPLLFFIISLLIKSSMDNLLLSVTMIAFMTITYYIKLLSYTHIKNLFIKYCKKS